MLAYDTVIVAMTLLQYWILFVASIEVLFCLSIESGVLFGGEELVVTCSEGNKEKEEGGENGGRKRKRL